MDNIKEKIFFEINDQDIGIRLDVFLSNVIQEATRSYIQKLISNGCVTINDVLAYKNGQKLKIKDKITVNIPEDDITDVIPEDIPLEIIYEDKDIAIINKHAGMVVHPAYGNYSGTLVNALLYKIKDLSAINGIIRPGIVHRLDKNTSGAIIIAKNDRAHVRLTEMFAEKTIQKTYLCIAKGIFAQKEGRVETLIGRDPKYRQRMAVVPNNGKNAITNYKIIDENGNYSLVVVKIETGRTHQIRVHMKYLNHPIIGDDVYGNVKDDIQRQMLHAYKIEFDHPITGTHIAAIAKLPDDFIKTSKKYGLDIDKIKEITK